MDTNSGTHCTWRQAFWQNLDAAYIQCITYWCKIIMKITWSEPHAQKAKFCAQRRRMCSVSDILYTSVKTHKMSFSARPLIQMNLLWVWKGGLKCTFLAWKIFFAKYRYFIIYRQKTDFLRMCSGSDPLHIRKNTQKPKFLLSQAFKWKKKYVFRNPRDAI